MSILININDPVWIPSLPMLSIKYLTTIKHRRGYHDAYIVTYEDDSESIQMFDAFGNSYFDFPKIENIVELEKLDPTKPVRFAKPSSDFRNPVFVDYININNDNMYKFIYKYVNPRGSELIESYTIHGYTNHHNDEERAHKDTKDLVNIKE